MFDMCLEKDLLKVDMFQNIEISFVSKNIFSKQDMFYNLFQRDPAASLLLP